MPTDLTYEKQGKVAWLRLSHPQHRLTPAMAEELAALCEVVEDDEEVTIVVLTGTGNVFCTGFAGPLGRKKAKTVHEVQAQSSQGYGVEALAAVTKPTLAALNGDAVEVGLELALACDIRLAVAGAQFGLPQIRDGLIPFCGGTQRLPRIVGQAKALELVLTGQRIDAAEAHRIGLVTEVITPPTFDTRIDEILADLLGKGPIALRLGKEAVRKAMDLTLDQGIRLEEDLYALLQTTRDRAEGIQSFLGKRKPVFTGH